MVARAVFPLEITRPSTPFTFRPSVTTFVTSEVGDDHKIHGSQPRTLAGPQRGIEPNYNTELKNLKVAIAGGGSGSLALAKTLMQVGADVRVFATEEELRGSQQSVLMDYTSLNFLSVLGMNLISKIGPLMRKTLIPTSGFRDGQTGDWIVRFDEIYPDLQVRTENMLVIHSDLQTLLRESLPPHAIVADPIVGHTTIEAGQVKIETASGKIEVVDVLVGARSERKSAIQPSQYSGFLSVAAMVHPNAPIPSDINLSGVFIANNTVIVVSDVDDGQSYEWRAYVPHSKEDPVPTIEDVLFKLREGNWARGLKGLFEATVPANVEHTLLYNHPFTGDLTKQSLITYLDETHPAQSIIDAVELVLGLPGPAAELTERVSDLTKAHMVRAASIHGFALMAEDALVYHSIPLVHHAILDRIVGDLYYRTGRTLHDRDAINYQIKK